MRRILFITAAIVIVIVAVASGNGAMMMRAAERSIAWSISREIAHEIFHGGGYR
jgi:hypothetical protein